MKGRPGPTKISIWIAKSLIPIQDEQHVHIENWKLVSAHQYGFLCTLCDHNKIERHRWNFIHSLINVYNIVPTRFEILNLLPRFHLVNDCGHFFIVHVSHEDVQIYVRGIVKVSSVEDYTCKTLDDQSTLLDYGKLRGPPKTWDATFWSSEVKFKTVKQIPRPDMNPFDLDSPHPIDFYMAVAVVTTGTNSTISINYSGPHIFVEIHYGFGTGVDRELANIIGDKFLTCYSEEYLSFDFYIAPFKMNLWLGLGISLVITCIIFIAYTYIKHGRVLFSVSFSFISLLFDDFTCIPRVIENQLFYRIIFSVWGPVAVLVINCYSGLIVTELNAPLESVRPEVAEDLICENRHIVDNYVEDSISNFLKKVPFDRYIAYWGNLDTCLSEFFCLTPPFKN